MREQLAEIFKKSLRESGETVSLVALAKSANVNPGERDVRLAFNDAKNDLVNEGIDFQPVKGMPGHYRRATPEGTLRRAGRDRRAGIRKMQRSVAKLTNGIRRVDLSSDPVLAQCVKRAQEKATRMLGDAIINSRKRNFDPTPAKRPENPRSVKAAGKEITQMVHDRLEKAMSRIVAEVANG